MACGVEPAADRRRPAASSAAAEAGGELTHQVEGQPLAHAGTGLGRASGTPAALLATPRAAGRSGIADDRH
jgi:hypothetical protein